MDEITLTGLVIKNFEIFMLNDKLKLNIYFSCLFTIEIVTICNFAMIAMFTFSGSV